MSLDKEKPGMPADSHLHKYGAIVLAAGYSSRMGQSKALLKLDGLSMLQRNIDLFLAGGLEEIFVVTGHEHQKVEEAVSASQAVTVHNARFDQGMFTSIQAGIGKARHRTDGCFVIPVDYPLVQAGSLHRLLEGVAANPGKWVVPTFHGKKGHPLFVPSAYFREILEYDGPDGLKGVTEKYREEFVKVPLEDEGVVLDVDDPAALDYAVRYIRNGCRSDSLRTLAKGRRLILVRHGQTVQHTGKIFLGQTDIPLSDIGRRQAREAGQQLLQNLKPGNGKETIFTSDLTRASETAAIIAAEIGRSELGKSSLGEPEVKAFSFLREIHLGDWDGKDIAAVAANQPDEFAYRGEHLMEYKRGNRGENFFDLQYRIHRGMPGLLAQSGGEQIVIVAHQSVLRAISHNLQGRDISEPWEPMALGEVRIVESD